METERKRHEQSTHTHLSPPQITLPLSACVDLIYIRAILHPRDEIVLLTATNMSHSKFVAIILEISRKVFLLRSKRTREYEKDKVWLIFSVASVFFSRMRAVSAGNTAMCSGCIIWREKLWRAPDYSTEGEN